MPTLQSPSTPVGPYNWQDMQAKLGLVSSAVAGPKANPGSSAPQWPGPQKISDLMKRQCQDGERTAYLTRLAGALFAKKFSLDDCIDMCKQWNEGNTPPLDDHKVEATCASLYATDLRNHPERHADALAAPDLPFFDLSQGRIDQYFSSAPPARRWLIKDLITLGKAAAVIAPGGSSKSQWLLQLAVGVASGIPVADHWEIGETGSVLMFCAEDDEDEIHRRLHRIQNHLQQSGQSQLLQGIEERLFVFSTIGRDMLVTKRSGSGEVVMTSVVDKIHELATKVPDLKLIVIDPAARFRGGEENSNEDATRFVEALESLAKATGASVMIAHHTNKLSYQKDAEPGQGASRGASALTDGLRWQMNLNTPSDAQLASIGVAKTSARKFVTAAVTKTNYSAIPEPVIMERLEGGYLSVVSTQTIKARAEMAAISSVLNAIVGHGKPITSRRLEDDYAGVHKTLKMPKERVREVVQIALTRGLLSGGSRKPLALTTLGRSCLEDTAQNPSVAGGAPAAVAPAPASAASRKKNQ